MRFGILPVDSDRRADGKDEVQRRCALPRGEVREDSERNTENLVVISLETVLL